MIAALDHHISHQSLRCWLELLLCLHSLTLFHLLSLSSADIWEEKKWQHIGLCSWEQWCLRSWQSELGARVYWDSDAAPGGGVTGVRSQRDCTGSPHARDRSCRSSSVPSQSSGVREGESPPPTNK